MSCECKACGDVAAAMLEVAEAEALVKAHRRWTGFRSAGLPVSGMAAGLAEAKRRLTAARAEALEEMKAAVKVLRETPKPGETP